MPIRRYIKHYIIYSIINLDKLQSDISTVYEMQATEEEKVKLLKDIETLNSIRNQIKSLEVNSTRFGGLTV